MNKQEVDDGNIIRMSLNVGTVFGFRLFDIQSKTERERSNSFILSSGEIQSTALQGCKEVQTDLQDSFLE